MAVPVRLMVPLDRLDGRRHTFGTYLTGLLGAVEHDLDWLAVTRKREKSYPFLEGMPQVEIPGILVPDRMYNLLFPAWARRFGPNVIHFPYRYAPYTWWGIKAKKVITVHDTALISLPGNLVEKMRKRTIWRYRRSLAGFDAVVTVSEASKVELCRHFDLPGHKVRVIHHGVDERFSPGPPTKDLEGLYSVRRPYILNVSSIKKKKNINGLVSAFGMLKREGYPHSLVLVGKPDNGLCEVKRVIEEQGLDKDVIITGFVDEMDHPDFYRQAEVMVYPSFYEGFGLPVLEAMACGCPVITSRASSLPEVAGDAAFLVDPKSIKDIFEAVKAMLDDAGRREEMISRGYERARLFTWQNSAAAHMALYRELLGEQPMRAGSN